MRVGGAACLFADKTHVVNLFYIHLGMALFLQQETHPIVNQLFISLLSLLGFVDSHLELAYRAGVCH